MIGAGTQNFSVTCWPGWSAVSGAQEVRPGEWGLVLHLDPVTLVVMPAPFPEGEQRLAAWARELSRAADQLAIALESDHEPSPRHLLIPKDPAHDEDDGAW